MVRPSYPMYVVTSFHMLSPYLFLRRAYYVQTILSYGQCDILTRAVPAIRSMLQLGALRVRTYVRHQQPQVKGIELDQSYCPVIALATIRLIVALTAAYHLTTSIVDVTNDFQNNIKVSYLNKIIDCPTH